jgi:IS1 family transposase
VNVLPFEIRVRAAGALVEGNSIRSVERMLGVHRDTIMRFGVLAGEACATFHRASVRDLSCSHVEIDEAWSFVGKKERRVKPGDPEEFGDAYIFVGMDANSKMIISWRVDKRSAEAADAFVLDLRDRVLGRPQITSDGFVPYREAVEKAFGADVDFAMLIKSYQGDTGNQAQHRYSPGRIRNIEKVRIAGRPDMNRASTSYIERQNLTLRMHIRRMTRLTNAFSKRLRNLKAAVALHFAHYNFCRVHETLRMTPAMAAGLTDHVWSVAELLAVVLGLPGEAERWVS